MIRININETLFTGQRRHLTHIRGAHPPLVSIANGLIGVCAQQNGSTMTCTQFKLGGREFVQSFAAVSCEDFGPTRVIHNLPEGQGFLAVKDVAGGSPFKDGKYLVKIGLDGRPTRLVHAGMTCPNNHEAISTKLFIDDKGRYWLSFACMKTSDDDSIIDLTHFTFKSSTFGPYP
ncbi:unnamed protein product [Trichogramma brassicae]|uniref:Uncharacterized protein n=1 Tax=Trichogramma brassicae TaxID=86971 RepID=A0A6H5I6S1_9HYME|nr:unnamed protein product [Trichogramma brassicae]